MSFVVFLHPHLISYFAHLLRLLFGSETLPARWSIFFDLIFLILRSAAILGPPVVD